MKKETKKVEAAAGGESKEKRILPFITKKSAWDPEIKTDDYLTGDLIGREYALRYLTLMQTKTKEAEGIRLIGIVNDMIEAGNSKRGTNTARTSALAPVWGFISLLDDVLKSQIGMVDLKAWRNYQNEVIIETLQIRNKKAKLELLNVISKLRAT